MGRQAEWALRVMVLATMPCVAPVNAQQTTDALAAPSGRVLGRVQDARGVALAEASVLLVDRDADGPVSGAPRRELFTDPSGRFVFGDVAPGRYLLLVEVPESPIPSRYFEVASGTDYETGDVELPPAVWLNGHVVTASGVPVGGIGVQCLRGPWGWTRGYVAARTDSGGRYRCGPVAGGETVAAFLDEPTAVRAVANWAAPAGAGEGGGPTLVYQPGAAVLVSVTDQYGNEIPEATLALLGTRDRQPQPNVEEVDGARLHQGIPPGDYKLTVLADGYYSSEPIRASLAAGTVFEHAVELRAPATAPLAVNVMVEGQHLEGVEISVFSEVAGMNDYRHASTDAAGNVTFEAFPVGRASVTAHYLGLRRLDEEFAVLDTGTAVSVTMEPYAAGVVTVRGRVVDTDGRPVPGSEVRLSAHPYSPIYSPAYRTETDDRGEFELRFVVENAYRLCVNKYAPVGSACFDDLRVFTHSTPDPLTLTLPHSAELRVVLRSPSGSELPSELWVHRPDVGDRHRTFGSDGEYRFPELGPGAWTVGATVGDVAYELGSVTLAAGSAHAAEFVYAPRFVALTGTIVIDGTPLAGATIRVSSRGRRGPWGMTVTDSQGRFALPRLLAGEGGVLVYRADGRRMHEQPLDLESDADLVLDIHTQRLHGFVRGRGGRPLGDARVQASAWGSSSPHEHDDIAVAEDGTFETWDLAEAEWRFHVSAPGYRTSTVTRTVSLDSAPEPLVVDLVPEAPLRVAVEPLDGRVPDQVRVTLCPTADPCDSDENHWTVRPDSSGEGVWANAPEGSWYASIWTGFERRDGLPITIPGEVLRIDRQRPIGKLIVRLPEFYGVAVPLTLQLLTPEGHQARGYQGGWRTAFTSPGYGELRASQLVAGEYLARVTASDGRVWEKAVTVEPIEQTVLFLRSEDLAEDPLGAARR